MLGEFIPPSPIPEVNLWIAKINQHLLDLALSSQKAEKVLARKQALKFFFNDYDQLEMVCDAAGVEIEAVLKAAHRVRREGTYWLAAPGKGKHYLRGKKYRDSLPGISKRIIIQQKGQIYEKET